MDFVLCEYFYVISEKPGKTRKTTGNIEEHREKQHILVFPYWPARFAGVAGTKPRRRLVSFVVYAFFVSAKNAKFVKTFWFLTIT